MRTLFGRSRHRPAPETGLRCFDVFDTVITRLVGHPSSVHLLVGMAAKREGLLDLEPVSFRWRRRVAERLARTSAPGGEPRLKDVYRAMLPGTSRSVVDRLSELEMDLECRLVRANPQLRAGVSRARLTHQVAFISDTYLPSEFVRRLLVREQLAEASDPVYVSCEHGSSKLDGTLFAHVSREQGPLASHTGDNLRSDVRAAAASGVSAVHYPGCALTRYEKELERHAATTNGLTSLFAGVSRLNRLRAEADGRADPRLPALCGVFAPMLVSFVSWILRRSEQLDASRIAFVARDGFLPARIAAVLQPEASTRTRYLHGGRQAWHFAAYSLGDELLPRWIVRGIGGLPFEAIAARLRLSLDDLPATRHAAMASWSRLGAEDRTRALRELLSNPAVLSLVRARSTEQRALLVTYLRQQKIGTDAWVLADLGRSGSSAAALTAVLRAAGLVEPTFLYLELADPVELAAVAASWDAFLSVMPDEHGFGPWPGPAVQLLESVATAPHGPVLGFTLGSDGTVEPELASESNAQADAWQWPALAAVVDRWASDFAEVRPLVRRSGDPRLALMLVLQEFVLRPTRAEAAAWGARSFADSPRDDDARPLVDRLTLRDSLRFGLTGKLPVSFWPQATAVLLPTWQRVAHRCVGFGRRLAGRAVRRQRLG